MMALLLSRTRAARWTQRVTMSLLPGPWHTKTPPVKGSNPRCNAVLGIHQTQTTQLNLSVILSPGLTLSLSVSVSVSVSVSRSRCLDQILVHLGLLTKESGFKIAENAFSGGPLGELVQWSDLITTLYLLGHDVRISASLAELKE